MKKIIIFKTDRVGDLLHLSGCIRSIYENFKDSKITLICSNHNFQIAKNYPFIENYIILEKGNYLKTLFHHFNILRSTKHSHLFILDGKNGSFFMSYFIKAETRSALCFWKVKQLFNFKYSIYRPNKFLLKFFFNNYIICDENYSNTQIKYQDLYFKLLENIKIKINSRKNHYVLNDEFDSIFLNFYKKYINKNYCIFHFDERWDKYKKEDLNNCLKIINILSSKMKVLITTGIKPFKYLNNLESLFSSFNYKNKNFIIKENKETGNVIILKNMPLDLLAFFIRNSVKNISNHSGPILHISAAFDINVVDIIKQSKFNELARWIPFGAKYKRYSFENLKENLDKI